MDDQQYIPIYCAHGCIVDKWSTNWQPHEELVGRRYAVPIDGQWRCTGCGKVVYLTPAVQSRNLDRSEDG